MQRLLNRWLVIGTTDPRADKFGEDVRYGCTASFLYVVRNRPITDLYVPPARARKIIPRLSKFRGTIPSFVCTFCCSILVISSDEFVFSYELH